MLACCTCLSRQEAWFPPNCAELPSMERATRRFTEAAVHALLSCNHCADGSTGANCILSWRASPPNSSPRDPAVETAAAPPGATAGRPWGSPGGCVELLGSSLRTSWPWVRGYLAGLVDGARGFAGCKARLDLPLVGVAYLPGRWGAAGAVAWRGMV